MTQARPFLSRLARDAAGNTLALAAAAMIPFTILVGSGVDLGVTYMARGKLQNACDAGVLAARQSMEGTEFDQAVEDEAQRFFDFNFPDGTAGAFDLEFEVTQDEDDESQLLGAASASVPTSLMRIVGVTELDIAVACDAKRDMGHNDVVLVLDVTGSMLEAASNGGGESRIARLRGGAAGIYRGLDGDDGSIIRFGIVPYSHTVNVARQLKNKDIVRSQQYVQSASCNWAGCTTTLKSVHINNSSWNMNPGNTGGNTQAFRTSGQGCIEERPSVGNAYSPFEIEDYITREDVDTQAGNAGNEPELQFGRYDPPSHTNSGSAVSDGVRFWRIANTWVQVGCPPEATLLQEYADEDAFQAAINAATATPTGGTYHDVGMLWGLRWISRTGYFSAENPTERDGIPVNQHIVFMTDGMLDTGETLYSAHGIERFQKRTQGFGSQDDKHLARFESACDLAKSMGITIWVIALDVEDTGNVEPCATSDEHFYESDGSDLEEIFEEIGRGIGNLRLTR
jgi:Flp pilus assembly protein TadG